MGLRCKDGDIAVIIRDTADCVENIGRLVEVRGPALNHGGMAAWRIRPVSPELYCVTEIDGSLTRESVTWASGVVHEDAWMQPIRPGAHAKSSTAGNSAPARIERDISEHSSTPVEEDAEVSA